MALPGGFFYVNSGLILAADEEAELAGSYGARDIACCGMPSSPRTDSPHSDASIPLIFVGGGIGYGAYEAAGPAAMLGF